MIHKQIIGKKGEQLAVDYLISNNYKICHKNWRKGKDEIDIIALEDDFIIFVEVKTRTSDFFGQPESFVNQRKQENMIRAANAYVEEKDIDKEVRFDIISIILSNNKTSLKHIKDAFNALS
ncbi:MAG: YraN family protein [Bacteroidetes bacterium HGW-Bacteroidetes-12]|nr:MAG: YraN family protein [Bacteroidetes bacterium HGW-Bacteroidetes-12]